MATRRPRRNTGRWLDEDGIGGECERREAASGRRRSGGRRSWTEVEKAILLRIVSGVYEPGQQLPSCEQLAAEVGANKNTVSKAYRSLAERGYLRTRAGSGTFVARRPARSDSDRAVSDIANLLALVVQEAKMAGLQRQQFLSLIDETVARFYDPVRPRVGYIDCNRLDATTLSRDLQVALSHPVEPLLIDEVAAKPAEYMAAFHILAMNLSHLAAVEQVLRSAVPSGGAEIIGLLVPTDPESLTQVARLRPGTRLGIVCDLTATLEALGGLVRGYNPGHRRRKLPERRPRGVAPAGGRRRRAAGDALGERPGPGVRAERADHRGLVQAGRALGPAARGVDRERHLARAGAGNRPGRARRHSAGAAAGRRTSRPRGTSTGDRPRAELCEVARDGLTATS